MLLIGFGKDAKGHTASHYQHMRTYTCMTCRCRTATRTRGIKATDPTTADENMFVCTVNTNQLSSLDVNTTIFVLVRSPFGIQLHKRRNRSKCVAATV